MPEETGRARANGTATDQGWELGRDVGRAARQVARGIARPARCHPPGGPVSRPPSTPGRGRDHPTRDGPAPLGSVQLVPPPPRRGGHCKDPRTRDGRTQSQPGRQELGKIRILIPRGDRRRGGALDRGDGRGTERFTVGIHERPHITERQPGQAQRDAHAHRTRRRGGPRPGGAARACARRTSVGSCGHGRTLRSREEANGRPEAIRRQSTASARHSGMVDPLASSSPQCRSAVTHNSAAVAMAARDRRQRATGAPT